MANIGIIGGGIAGLHLGHFLRQHGVACTMYSVQSPEEIANGRIQNTVAHHNTTLERERQLGIHFWDAASTAMCATGTISGASTRCTFVATSVIRPAAST